MNRTPALLLVFAISWAVASGAHALSYDEGIQGDLSGDFAASTVLGQLAGGSNTVSGTSTAGSTVVMVDDGTGNMVPVFPEQDVDVWTITIAPNMQLDKIVLAAFSFTPTGLLGPADGDGSWLAVQTGTEITDPNSPAALKGGTLLGMLAGALQGDDILDDLGLFTVAGVPIGPPGFSGPLAAGTYTFWYQEGPTDTTYSLDFQVSTVPEPSTALLFGFGLGLVGALRRGASKAGHGLN